LIHVPSFFIERSGGDKNKGALTAPFAVPMPPPLEVARPLKRAGSQGRTGASPLKHYDENSLHPRIEKTHGPSTIHINTCPTKPSSVRATGYKTCKLQQLS
jgi:hypothetical protein